MGLRLAVRSLSSPFHTHDRLSRHMKARGGFSKCAFAAMSNHPPLSNEELQCLLKAERGKKGKHMCTLGPSNLPWVQAEGPLFQWAV